MPWPGGLLDQCPLWVEDMLTMLHMKAYVEQDGLAEDVGRVPTWSSVMGTVRRGIDRLRGKP